MKGIVNIQQRYAKMRAHTATHLLHAALNKILPQTKQAWSLVDQDYLRFDYSSDDLLTYQQIHEIAAEVNSWILWAYPVSTDVKSFDQAVASWAKAFFEDKYWDEVRVVTIKDSAWENFSVELCGWTHVDNTSLIGAFVIVEHGWVSSWVKRLVAYTWPKVAEFAMEKEMTLVNLATKLKAQPQHLDQKIDKIIKEKDEALLWLNKLNEASISAYLKQSSAEKTIQGFDFFLIEEDAPSAKDFKLYSNISKNIFKDVKVVIYNNQGSFAIIGDWAKQFAQSNKLKWGWSDTFVQGRDPEVVNIFK